MPTQQKADYVSMLQSWGFKRIHWRSGELVADCIFCGGKWKFYFNTENLVALCFRGCYSGSVVGLISLIEGVDSDEATSRLNIGVDWFSKFKTKMLKKEYIPSRRTPFQMPGDRKLNNAETNYLDKRKMSLSLAKSKGAVGSDDLVGLVAAFRDCEISAAEKLIKVFPGKFEYLRGRIIWPVHGRDGTLLGAEARNITGKEPKVCYPTGINLKRTLYLSENSKRNDWIVLVEGIVDEQTLENWQYSCGSTFSSGISREQSIMLHAYARVYCAYDGDKGGFEGLISVVRRIYDACLIYDVKLPKGKDPNDLSQYEFDTAFAKAQLVTDSHPAVVKHKDRVKRKRRSRG